MKILFLSFPGLNLLEGGVRSQVYHLKNNLEKLGLKIELFGEKGEISLKEFDLIHCFGAGIGTYHLFKMMSDLGCRLILTPVFFSRRPATLWKIALRPFFPLFKKLKVYNQHYLVKEMAEKAELIITNTFAEKELLSKGLGLKEEKIRVVPNGVDESFYYAKPDLCEKELGLKDFILYVGHIGYERKNLLRALRVLKKVNHPTLITGKIMKNDYSKRCLELIRKAPNIKLIEEIPHKNELLSSIYSACDTFLLPSYYETPGLAALEAGLCGAKIVITKYGGTKEYFKDYAYYLNPYSEKDIFNKLQSALNEKKDPRLKEHIRKHFLWSEVAKQLWAIYSEVLDSSKGR